MTIRASDIYNRNFRMHLFSSFSRGSSPRHRRNVLCNGETATHAASTGAGCAIRPHDTFMPVRVLRAGHLRNRNDLTLWVEACRSLIRSRFSPCSTRAARFTLAVLFIEITIFDNTILLYNCTIMVMRMQMSQSTFQQTFATSSD